METPEGFERHMREVLHGADDHAAGFTAAQVIAKGRNRRRTRTATVSGVALVAAGAVAVVPSTVGGGRSQGRGGVVSAAAKAPDPARTAISPSTSAPGAVPDPPASSSAKAAPTSPASPASPAPSAHVVAPGTLPIGNGYTIELTSDSMTLAGHGGQVGPIYTDNGNQARDSIGVQQCGQVVAGVYLGSGEAVTGTVTADGKAYPATVVTLAGHPGWSVAYAMLPTSPSTPSKIAISVSDAAGHQLASFTPPAH